MIVATISEKVDKSDVESISSVNEQGIPAPAYSVASEPPSYKKATSASVRIARLIAFTVVAVALILGAAIIIAAYLQTRHTVTTTIAPAATETNVKAAGFVGVPSALKSETNKIDSSGESSTEDDDNHKDGKRRLDSEGDLLEEFLENEGKILRLPTGNDLDIDIDDLTKMFLKRNPLDKSKCVVERRPIGAADDLIKVLPITAKNASALPLAPFITGERVSIICSSDDDDANVEDDSGLIRSRPIPAPFGMRPPPMMRHPIGPIGAGLSVNPVMSVMGPFPFVMNQSPVLPASLLRTLRPIPPPLHLQQQQQQQQHLINNLMAEQRNINNLIAEQRNINNLMAEQRNFNVPPPAMRNPFAAFPAPRPLPRLPELTPVQNRPMFPVLHQMQQPAQPFQPLPQPPRPMFTSPFQAERRIPFPMPPMPENNSQEKSHVPEQRVAIAPLDQNPLVPPPVPSTPRPAPRMPERPHPVIPGLPIGLLTLLRDLPHAGPTEQPPTQQRLSIQPGQHNAPLFRVPKPLLNHPDSDETPKSAPVQQPARPVTLPFLQVPPVPSPAKEGPIPVSVPFLRIRPIPASAAAPSKPDDDFRPVPSRSERRHDSPAAFFERLIDSLISTGGPARTGKSLNAAPKDSVPMEARNAAPIRSGSRGLRMPADGPVPDELVVARPVDSAEDDAPRQDRRGRSHFIQPRSVSED